MAGSSIRIGVIAALVALAVGLAACGGDDETTTTTSSTASGATGVTGATGSTDSGSASSGDFVGQANRICREGNREIQADFSQFGTDAQPSPEEIADVLLPTIQDQIDQLRALDPPAEDADAFDTALTEAEDAIDAIENDPSAVAQGSGDPFADVSRRFDQLGLTDCAS